MQESYKNIKNELKKKTNIKTTLNKILIWKTGKKIAGHYRWRYQKPNIAWNSWSGDKVSVPLSPLENVKM